MSLLYTFYGDDFTGSTDVLEQLAANGVRSALFLSPPTSEQMARFPDLQAFGVAGDSRSRSPAWMTSNLPAAFAALRTFSAPIVQYKVCSTFDSTPHHGSIGRTIELGLEAFHPRFVPIVVGAPHLRRFVYEGRLFASAPDGLVHRIDRHPMSRHPVTPMREPDLREHLRKQTALPLGHVAYSQLTDAPSTSAAIESELRIEARAILFDTVDQSSLDLVGEFLWRTARERPLFCVGSSGLTSGLVAAWREQSLIHTVQTFPHVEPISPLLVVSGSCSEATACQITWASEHNFHLIHARPERLLDKNSGPAYERSVRRKVEHSLSRATDTILYTSIGEGASRVAGEELGSSLGSILRDLLSKNLVSRVVLCGGDTCSHAVQQLGLSTLTWKASVQTGAPLCQAHFVESSSRPLELILKGGQVGTADFFAIAKGVRS